MSRFFCDCDCGFSTQVKNRLFWAPNQSCLPQRLRDDNKNKICIFEGVRRGGREENCPQNAVFLGKRHDNKISKVKTLLSSNFFVIAQAATPRKPLRFFLATDNSLAIAIFFCDFARKEMSPLRFGWRRGRLRQKIEAVCDCDFWCSQVKPRPSFPLFFVWKRQGKPPKEQGFFCPYRTSKIPEKEGSKAQNNKEFLARDKTRNSKKQGKEGEGRSGARRRRTAKEPLKGAIASVSFAALRLNRALVITESLATVITAIRFTCVCRHWIGNARLFIILFVRNSWRVCSQFWLSVCNSVWGPSNRESRGNPSLCWLGGGGGKGARKLWTKMLWTNLRYANRAIRAPPS